MPYIKQDSRSQFMPLLGEFMRILDSPPGYLEVGEMNFLFTKLIHQFLRNRGKNYKNLNAMIGVLECCKQELYRRVVSPYEDTKIEENGDVV